MQRIALVGRVILSNHTCINTIIYQELIARLIRDFSETRFSFANKLSDAEDVIVGREFRGSFILKS